MDFLPGVSEAYVIGRLSRAAGKELSSGKAESPVSSSALAVNCFGWFHACADRLPPFSGLEENFPARRVEVEYEARFPWRGGHHPWLDAAIFTHNLLIGVESKRFEPYRDKKTALFKDTYDRPVWGDGMQPFEATRDHLKTQPESFAFLDAAQLVKHAFGLVTDGRRQGLKPVLIYLYAEPEQLNDRAIDATVFSSHRAEIARFAAMVQGAEVAFQALSYREWLARWPSEGEVAAHAQAILATFQP